MTGQLPATLDLENAEFKKAYKILHDTNVNLFLTGKAGTGKSTFLRYICREIDKKYVILAPTGVAAVNVGGVTIHSFFQMPLRPVPPNDPDYSIKALSKSAKYSKNKRKLIKELDLIIIDEISMVRPDMIDFIDRALRAVRGEHRKPFGGVQLLLVGDIFQLEPVVTSDTKAILSLYYKDFFFFNALAYSQTNLISIELQKIYRQTDSSFINLLDRVRLNRTTAGDLALLNSRMLEGVNKEGLDSEFGIVLASRRDAAAAINAGKMEELPTEEFVFEGEIEDDFPEKILPTELSLTLKKDAQVMIIRNDKERRWVNGTLAKVHEISEDKIILQLENGNTVQIEKETWENINYTYDEKEKKVKEEVIGRFTQYPLKAAWALTIHKSQGLTFSNVTIDMGGGAFSAGQTYVALSRCRSLEGLSFINPLRRYDIIVSRGASEFSTRFNDDDAMKRVIDECMAGKMSREATVLLADDDFRGVVENLWKAHVLTGCLNSKVVRRLLSVRLAVIKRLKSSVSLLRKRLDKASVRFALIGDSILEEGGNMEEAKKMYEYALEADESNYHAMIGKARCMMLGRQPRKAYALLDKIIKGRKAGAYEASLMKGDMLAGESNLSGAALNYITAHKLKPASRVPIELLVTLYEEAGMPEEAAAWRDTLNPKISL